MAKTKAVVLCSGGLNSTVLTSIARQEHVITMLHVRFGHRAEEKELALFEKQVEHFDPQQNLIIDLPHVASIGGNARVSRKQTLEDARAMGDEPSNGYVPGLISSLLSAAFTWANVIGAGRILIGLSEDLGPPSPRTSSIYPDYSREHVELCGNAFLMASTAKPVKVEMPLIDLSRTDIVKLGQRLGTPFELTWSCLSSGEEPCGACVGCATRAHGFVEAGLGDPIRAREMAEAR